MAKSKASVSVQGPFSGIVAIFLSMTGPPYTLSALTTPPVQYVFVALSAIVTCVGMFSVITGMGVFKSTRGFTFPPDSHNDESLGQNVTNIINEAVDDSKRLER